LEKKLHFAEILKKVFFLGLLILAFPLWGQGGTFPVQVIPQVIPPPPIYLSNYADASTVNSPLRVQIILNDLNIQSREVRLKAYFQGSGLTFQSNDFVTGANQLFLEGGVPLILTNAELAPYFRFENITGISPNVYGNSIPEGTYQFCFEVFDVATGNRLSNKSCVTTVIFKNEPPFLVSPRNKTNIAETNPQNIIFQWTPRSINVTNAEYELSLVEIWDSQIDPQAAFLSSPPIFQTTTAATTYVFGPSDPQLLSGKNYAWRIQAKAKQGTEEIGLFKNQGYSEIFSFSYASACDLPLSINHEVKGSTIANIFWDDFSTDIPEYTVRYRKKSGSNSENEWFFNKTTSNTTSLWDLKSGTIYEYQIQKKCTVTKSEWSITKQFTTFIADNEESVYECGITPDFSLSNTDPLQTLAKGDKFTAGDFPINVLEVSGSNGRFTGKGYVTIPYLNSIRVGVKFTNILVNTEKQMAEGMVITMYDATLGNLLDIDEAIETVGGVVNAVGDLIESADDFFNQVFNDDDSNEENAPPDESIDTTDNSGDNTTTEGTTTTNNDSNPENSSTSNTSNTDGGETSIDNNETGQGTDQGTQTTSSTDEEVVINHNGIDYKNNHIIEVPFNKNNSNYAFLLKNYPEGATFNWQVLRSGTDNTATYVTNEPKYDNLGIDMKNVYLLDVVANYNNKKIKVNIKRVLEDFDLVNMYAKPEGDDNTKRVAKSGQKLYLMKSSAPLVNADRKVDFSIHISPNLSKGDISSQDVKWYYEEPNTQYNLGKKYGKKDIHLNLTEQDSPYSVNVKAGKPDLIEKGIDVVWFDRNETAYSFVPPAVSSVLTQKMEDIEGILKYSNKFFSAAGVKFELEPIKISGSKRNLEDKGSRLYKYIEKGDVSGGLKVEWKPKKPITIPQLAFLSRAGIADVGIIPSISLSLKAKGGVERYKFVEKSDFEDNDPFLELSSAGCLDIKLGAELLVARDLIEFNIYGGAKGCIQGKIAYKFKTEDFSGRVSIPPVILYSGIKIKSKGSVLNFTLVDWSGSISITDEILLYPRN
tara:strand:+ start:2947 stop:6072 length:3126 start_codon:yes stop_codon:yes gene_type:complete